MEKYYISENGSKVKEFGKCLRAFDIEWDWFEEGACVESRPTWDWDEKCIVAFCECLDSPFVVKCREVTREEWEAA